MNITIGIKTLLHAFVPHIPAPPIAQSILVMIASSKHHQPIAQKNPKPSIAPIVNSSLDSIETLHEVTQCNLTPKLRSEVTLTFVWSVHLFLLFVLLLPSLIEEGEGFFGFLIMLKTYLIHSISCLSTSWT